MVSLCIYSEWAHLIIIIFLWLISILTFWNIKHLFSKNIEYQASIFIFYALIITIVILMLHGGPFDKLQYIPNLVTELIGILITVLLIERIYNYIRVKNEKLYGKLAITYFRGPIFTYCAHWFEIYEPNPQILESELKKYHDLESFFKSDDFYNKVIKFDFNKLIGKNKTYAQYYGEHMTEITDRFQNILAKYASKLSLKNIRLIEHFGGKAYFFTVFAVMKFISEVKFTHQSSNGKPSIVIPFNNSFKDIKRVNFQRHFDKLIELINSYNNAVDEDYEKWSINNITKRETIASANDNPMTEW